MAESSSTGSSSSSSSIIERLPISEVIPSPYNTRRTTNEHEIMELTKSIRENGLLQPITVRRMDDHYETIFGNRRLEAHKRLKAAKIDALVIEKGDDDAYMLNLTENVQRVDMDPLDVANAVHHIHESDPITWTYAAIGRKIGKSRAWVFEMAKLTDRAAPEVLDAIAGQDQHGKVPEGKLDYRSGLELTRKIPDQDRQRELISTLTDSHLKGVKAREIINRVARHPDEQVNDVIASVIQQPAKFTIDAEDMERIVQRKAHGVTVQFLDPKIKEHEPVELYSRVESADVDKIIRKKFKDLNKIDVKVGGFSTLNDLVQDLERKYGELDPEQYIFTVHFLEP
jgi:ParB/RepB/Spo0J family partition protein